MTREEVRSFGITDNDTIDKILDANSRDIGKFKDEIKEHKASITTLQGQVNQLKPKAESVDGLNATIAQLTTDKTNLTNELNTKVNGLKRDHAIESKVRDANARNVKAVMAQLDLSKITYENDVLTGLDEQLTALKGDNGTAFLFGDGSPAGTHQGNNNNGGNHSGGNGGNTANSFASAIANSLKLAN